MKESSDEIATRVASSMSSGRDQVPSTTPGNRRKICRMRDKPSQISELRKPNSLKCERNKVWSSSVGDKSTNWVTQQPGKLCVEFVPWVRFTLSLGLCWGWPPEIYVIIAVRENDPFSQVHHSFEDKPKLKEGSM